MAQKSSVFSGVFLLLFCLFFSSNSQAQNTKYQEYGFWLGGANYHGDLNPLYGFSNIRPGGGVFYKYSVGPYLAFKGGVNFARLRYKDANSNEPFLQRRNLSFRSNITELAAQVEFNFKKYIPGNKKHFYSPYLTLGVSVFKFNPQAQIDPEVQAIISPDSPTDNTWYDLRDLGTEGQQNSDFTQRTPYKLVQPAIPIGIGYKHWISHLWNLGFEVNYRFTFTDYLDDVSGQYVDPNILGAASTNAALADPSIATGPSIGESGRQRGDSVSNDGFLFIGIFVTYTIFQGNCPQQ